MTSAPQAGAASSVPFHRITAAELAERRRSASAGRLIDIREPFEWTICRIDGAEHKPLSAVQTWWRELDPHEPLVFYCHHGNRSASLCAALAVEGFTDLWNLEGGIEDWSVAVDPTVPRY
jgi:rhodanese-related sulfurtransferase